MGLSKQWRIGLFLAGLSVQFNAGAQPVMTDSVFSPDSFWYTPIPAEAPLHPDSAAYVADFLRQKKAFYGNVHVNTRQYASPVYVAADDIPAVKVVEWDCQKKGFRDTALAEQWAAVPIPEYAEPSRGTDGEMTVYQPSTDTIWEFWQARKVNGQWQACWGGRLRNASGNPGIFDKHYGTTATSLPFLGGQVTADELKRGEIRHAIGIALVETEHADIFSWPAGRSDGFNPKKLPNRIPEGIRMRLDPAVNVDALKMSDAGKVIARAAQKYGFIVWDKAGSISIRAQNPVSYTALGQPDPYPSLFAYKPNHAFLDGFPWERLQFLPMNYGKP
ncbi:hypothetical protein MTYP_01636 [Methylophilaceae bacterium]|nr:hypothetical protein MTYP_01636 [Methylophilaceae bacterium]